MPAPDMMMPADPPVTPLGQYRVLSKLAGIRVSPLVFGGMSIGKAWSTEMGQATEQAEKSAHEVLDAFFDAGGNFIDTANNYQDTDSESWIGNWMEARGIRDSIVLSTKYTTSPQLWNQPKGVRTVNTSGNHRKSLRLSVEGSLRRLKTDYIDLLFVHWWDWSTSIEEVMDSLHILVQQGKVLYLGASDLPAWVVATANAYAKSHGKTPFSVYQGPWNIIDREMEKEVIPLCRHYGMAIMPWNAMGAGKFKTEAEVKAREAAGTPLRGLITPVRSESEIAISRALDEVAHQIATANSTPETVPSVTAIALAWIMHKAPYVVPLVGGSNIAQLKQNIDALSIHLTDKQIEFLEAVAPPKLSMLAMMIGQDPAHTGTHPLLDAVAPMAYVRSAESIQKTGQGKPGPSHKDVLAEYSK